MVNNANIWGKLSELKSDKSLEKFKNWKGVVWFAKSAKKFNCKKFKIGRGGLI